MSLRIVQIVERYNLRLKIYYDKNIISSKPLHFVKKHLIPKYIVAIDSKETIIAIIARYDISEDLIYQDFLDSNKIYISYKPLKKYVEDLKKNIVNQT